MVAPRRRFSRDRGDVRDIADQAARYGREAALHAKDRVNEALEGLAQTGRQTARDMERNIKQRPLVWTLSALGIGLVIGSLLRLRRD